MPNSKLFSRSHFISGLMIGRYCSLCGRMTNYLKSIRITVLVFVFAFTGCKAAEQNVQRQQVSDPVARRSTDGRKGLYRHPDKIRRTGSSPPFARQCRTGNREGIQGRCFAAGDFRRHYGPVTCYPESIFDGYL